MRELSQGIKREGREADYSSPFTAKVKTYCGVFVEPEKQPLLGNT
jgi:hypothetical protein